MSKRMTCFLYAIVFALGAADCVEAVWLVILLYALRSINQKFKEGMIIAGGLASLGEILKAMKDVAVLFGDAKLVYPLRSLANYVGYMNGYNYIMAMVSVLCLVISIAFVIAGCVSKN